MSQSNTDKSRAFLWLVWSVYFIAGMHCAMPNLGGSGLHMSFNAVGWIFASLMISCSLWQITARQAVTVSPIWTWLAFGAMLLFVPEVYSNALLAEHAIPRLLGLAGGVVFLFGLYQWRFDHDSRVHLLYWVLGAVAIELALGLVQLFLLEPGNWIGFDPGRSRPYGIFQQPKVMASFVATGIAIAAWLSAIDRR